MNDQDTAAGINSRVSVVVVSFINPLAGLEPAEPEGAGDYRPISRRAALADVPHISRRI